MDFILNKFSNKFFYNRFSNKFFYNRFSDSLSNRFSWPWKFTDAREILFSSIRKRRGLADSPMPFYVVARTANGRGEGIYTDWTFAKPYCIDASCNEPIRSTTFKKFEKYSDAIKFMNNGRPTVASSSAVAYFHGSNSKGGVFRDWQALLKSLGPDSSAQHDIEFVQRKSGKSAQDWLEKKFAEPDQESKKRSADSLDTSGDTSEAHNSRKKKIQKRDQQSRRDGSLELDRPSGAPKLLEGKKEEKNTSACHFSSLTGSSLVAWTDGACLKNGKRSACGGYGVWFGDNDPRNCSGPLPPEFLQTSQRAELFAIQRALEVTKDDPRPLEIRTDSQYAKNSLTEWLPQWRENGFMTANKTPVKNQDLIQDIDHLIHERGPKNVRFEHVKGHSSDYGNRRADSLAARGAKAKHLGLNESLQTTTSPSLPG